MTNPGSNLTATQALALTPDELITAAGTRRDALFGARLTYSPKVFIPLTKLCRDRCGYCTFAQPPARVESPYMTPQEILAVARQGARAGCHEALFTLGEAPEERYPAAAEWLHGNGYDSTVHYLAEMAALVLRESGLLPHANPGAVSGPELAMLRRVCPSQGMMIETLRDDLECHRGAPDKRPERRLATLEAAGELRIPYTTGILVGIGESRTDRARALEAIAESHRRHGHVQEVIVQNFRPKSSTAMAAEPPCDRADFIEAIAMARLICDSDIHIQAPPNLSDDFGELLDAGLDDWGGVSPVTADHVNPERPWPAIEKLRTISEANGFTMAPRLTIHPEFAGRADWLDSELRFAVMDRADAEMLARDDPGAVFPEVSAGKESGSVNDGAEVIQIGQKSTQWYSGSPIEPMELITNRAKGDAGVSRETHGTPGLSARLQLATVPETRAAPTSGGPVSDVIEGVRQGQTLGENEITALFSARGPEVAAVGALADDIRAEVVGDDVTWVANRNINYTNVCTFKCRFCGFSKGPLSLNLRGKPYLLTLDDIAERAREAEELGATEVCLQGGIHPDFDGDYYLDVTRAVSEAAPKLHIHGFTALEVTEGAKRLDEPLDSYLRRMKEAGLKTLPGTAAEILDDEVRATLCPDKVNSEEWLQAHRTAHGVGLRSNVTMMFGSIESPRSWARHLLVTRELQAETGGFTEFVGLPFVHMASPIYLQKHARRGPTFREVVLVHAVARIVYQGLIDNVQGSWVKVGMGGLRQLLLAGANDLGGTLMDENISRAAGAEHGTSASAAEFAAAVEPLGRRLVQRTTLYEQVAAAPSAVLSGRS